MNHMTIEERIISYLNGALDEIQAYGEKPTNKNPDGNLFVVVEKTGVQRNDMLYTSTVAIQSYAPTLYQAADLDEDVRAVMFALPDNLSEVSGIRLIGGGNFTDPSTRQPRYQSVFDVHHY